MSHVDTFKKFLKPSDMVTRLRNFAELKKGEIYWKHSKKIIIIIAAIKKRGEGESIYGWQKRKDYVYAKERIYVGSPRVTDKDRFVNLILLPKILWNKKEKQWKK